MSELNTRQEKVVHEYKNVKCNAIGYKGGV